MKERLFESVGRGVPVEFPSAWNKDQSMMRLRKLLLPHHFGSINDALIGHVEDEGVVLKVPSEPFMRASGDMFSGQLQDDEKGVRLVGEFRVSTYTAMTTTLFIGALFVFVIMTMVFGLSGLVNKKINVSDALATIFLLPIPAIFLGLVVLWWQSLSRKELSLISKEIQFSLSNS